MRSKRGGALGANLACEAHVARLDCGVALRFGEFYGPADTVSRAAAQLARRGVSLVGGRPGAWHSALHTSDVGPAVEAALRAPPGMYNVVDDEPMRRAELRALLAESAARRRLLHPPAALAQRAGPAPMRALTRSQRVCGRRFRETTGWAPSVPSRRIGWPQVFAAQ